MLNYKSVTNSEPQVRSNPALRHVSSQSGFHKRLSTLMEPTPLPFPTFQIVKDNSKSILETHLHYAWVRPAYLRSQWLVLSDTMPLLLWDQRNETRIHSLRIPFDKKRIQEVGTVICEAAWDAQDHILYIWDVIVWERTVVWNTMGYSKRWELVKELVGQILDCGHPMSDAEVRVPTWESLEQIAERSDLDPATSIDFQPEKPGQRRRIFLVQDEGVKFRPTTHAERKMVADKAERKEPSVKPRDAFIKPRDDFMKHKNTFVQSTEPLVKINDDNPRPLDAFLNPKITPIPETTVRTTEPPQAADVQAPLERPTVCRLSKDISKLPDTYRLTSIEGENLGLAAIRSM
jgi:hypothetical protein